MQLRHYGKHGCRQCGGLGYHSVPWSNSEWHKCSCRDEHEFSHAAAHSAQPPMMEAMMTSVILRELPNKGYCEEQDTLVGAKRYFWNRDGELRHCGFVRKLRDPEWDVIERAEAEALMTTYHLANPITISPVSAHRDIEGATSQK